MQVDQNPWGLLANIGQQIAQIQDSQQPQLKQASMLVFCGDHGISHIPGVSACPREVTAQVTMNFLNGGAGINAFCRLHQIKEIYVDSGIDWELDSTLNLIDCRIRRGTSNTMNQAAMTPVELDRCLKMGAKVCADAVQMGAKAIGIGEMGIANTAASSLVLSCLLNRDIRELTGRGSGVKDLNHKQAVLAAIRGKYPQNLSAYEALWHFAGFEMAQMVGAMLECEKQKVVLLIDGFIATTCFLAAVQLQPSLKSYAILCHKSAEAGHRYAVEALAMEPILDLSLRLGEGTGCALAYPIIQSACHLYHLIHRGI